MHMKYISVLILAMAFGLASCDAPPASDNSNSPKASETSNPSDRSQDKPKAGPPKLGQEEPVEAPAEENGFQAFAEKYPTIELPQDFPWVAPDMAKEWVSRPVDQANDSYIIGEGKIKRADDEQAFHAARFERGGGVHALITYLQGDFNERLVLTTHSEDGSLIAVETLNKISEEETYGYSSQLSKGFKIFRSEMFYRTDERTGKQVMEVDHEDIFMIQEDGKIVQE